MRQGPKGARDPVTLRQSNRTKGLRQADSLTSYASEAGKFVYARTSSISSTAPSDVPKGAATYPGRGGNRRFSPGSCTRSRWD
jgi:hypothetical protein